MHLAPSHQKWTVYHNSEGEYETILNSTDRQSHQSSQLILKCIFLNHNMIKNCPVTSQDMKVAKATWGEDVPTLKGCTIRRKLTPSAQDIIQVPKRAFEAQKCVHLFMDIPHVNGMPYLTSISKHIMHRTAAFLVNRKAKSIYSEVDAILLTASERSLPTTSSNHYLRISKTSPISMLTCTLQQRKSTCPKQNEIIVSSRNGFAPCVTCCLSKLCHELWWNG